MLFSSLLGEMIQFDEHHQISKNFPTYPWNIPQTPNQRFMKEFLSFGGLGIPGVCSKGMLGFSLKIVTYVLFCVFLFVARRKVPMSWFNRRDVWKLQRRKEESFFERKGDRISHTRWSPSSYTLGCNPLSHTYRAFNSIYD